MTRIHRAFILFAVTLLVAAGQANASLIGDTVSVERDATGCCGFPSLEPSTQVIGPGGTTFISALHDVLVESTRITLLGKNTSGSFYTGSTLADQFADIFDLDFFGAPGGLVDISVSVIGDLGLSSGLPFNPITDVQFDAHSVQVRLAGLQYSEGSRVVIDLLTDAATVPEPPTLPLIAIAALGFAIRRRMKLPR